MGYQPRYVKRGRSEKNRWRDSADSASTRPMTIGHRIEQARKAAGLSRHRLGVACDVTPDTIASWEAGRVEPRASAITSIAERCGCAASWLLTGEGQGPRVPNGVAS